VARTSLTARDLSNREAICAVQWVIQEWAKRNGLALLAIWQQIEQARDGRPIEQWLISPLEDDEDAGEQCRSILRTWLDLGSPALTDLARAGIEVSKQAQAQVLDPLSISVYGLVMIGLVVALRLDQVNVSKSRTRIKLAKLPAGALQILKTASRAISKLPGLGI
jgi:hypothetical protein